MVCHRLGILPNDWIFGSRYGITQKNNSKDITKKNYGIWKCEHNFKANNNFREISNDRNNIIIMKNSIPCVWKITRNLYNFLFGANQRTEAISRNSLHEKFTLTVIFFRQINSSDLFSECVAFTKFLPKNVRVNFRTFHTV